MTSTGFDRPGAVASRLLSIVPGSESERGGVTLAAVRGKKAFWGQYGGFLLIAGLALGVLGFLLWQGHRDALRSAEGMSRGVLAVYESHLNAALRRADAALVDLAAAVRPQLESRRGGRGGWSTALEPINNRLTGFNEIVAVYLVDGEGMLRYGSDSSSVDLDVSDRD